MLPGLLQNLSNVHEYFAWLLKHNGGTFEFKGPWFTGMNFVLASDPMNVHNICSQNFSNYPKGPEFQEAFESLGDGIFSSDHDSWGFQRKLFHTLLKDKYKVFFEEVTYQGKGGKGPHSNS